MTIEFYVQHGEGTEPRRTEYVEHIVSSLWWQDQGLSFTASGYGSKIPTRYKVKYNGRWMRVYCRIYSNVGSLYIVSKGVKLYITTYNE